MGLWSSIRGDVFGSLAGGLIGSVFGGNSAKKQAALQRQNWAYQQQNAHQFEVGDLKAAGLNPILSATNSQIAGMGSAPSTSDNGVGAGVTNSITAALTRQANVEIEKTKADIALKEAQTNAANARTNAISAGIYGNDISKAVERYNADTANVKADTAEKTSAKNVNEANVGYIRQQTVSLKDITQAQVAQIKQDISNSIAQTKALVEKYGAESQQARASAALSYKQIETEAAKAALYLSQKTHEDWDSNRIIRELSDPDSNLHRDYRNTPFGTILGYIGEGIKDLIPFRFGLGVRK